mmetsp:Transcript_77418/g.160870  ORF Transcript_77418/g.160870 Transcript_77418/m.160870 type:complete len:232 (+) Transcript_77418:4260-4955(+)
MLPSEGAAAAACRSRMRAAKLLQVFWSTSSGVSLHPLFCSSWCCRAGMCMESMPTSMSSCSCPSESSVRSRFVVSRKHSCTRSKHCSRVLGFRCGSTESDSELLSSNFSSRRLKMWRLREERADSTRHLEQSGSAGICWGPSFPNVQCQAETLTGLPSWRCTVIDNFPTTLPPTSCRTTFSSSGMEKRVSIAPSQLTWSFRLVVKCSTVSTSLASLTNWPVTLEIICGLRC